MIDHVIMYVARVRDDGSICIHRHDQSEPVAVVTLLPGVSLRETLEEAGWRPTGRRARGGGWAAIYVHRLTRAEVALRYLGPGVHNVSVSASLTSTADGDRLVPRRGA
jgi:hypothetical protein